MKKLTILVLLGTCILSTPALAQKNEKHAAGNMYTTVLNMIESRGWLHNLEPKRQGAITDMHIDHGQVFVTFTTGKGPVTAVYDMIGNKFANEDELPRG